MVRNIVKTSLDGHLTIALALLIAQGVPACILMTLAYFLTRPFIWYAGLVASAMLVTVITPSLSKGLDGLEQSQGLPLYQYPIYF